MFQKYLKTLTWILVLLLAATAAGYGQESKAVTEFDPAVTLALELTKKVRLDAYVGRERSEEIQATRHKAAVGVSFRVKPVFKRFLDAVDTDKKHLLVVGALYEYSVASDKGARAVEHRLMVDATLRYVFRPNLLFSNKSRVEFRWVNGDGHIRYRDRPVLERPFKLFKRDLTPYVAGEAFWDSRYSKWNIFKFSSGIVVPLFHVSALEFFYERQHCGTCDTRNTNIFGVNYNIALRLKHK